MNNSTPLFVTVFLLAGLVAIVSSYMVSMKMIWIPFVSCVLAGLAAGIYSSGFPSGIFPGIVFGIVLALFLIPGLRLTRYYRNRARTELDKKGITMEDLFKKE